MNQAMNAFDLAAAILLNTVLGLGVIAIAMYIINAAISEIPIFKLDKPGHCSFCGARMPEMPEPPKVQHEYTRWAIEHHSTSCLMQPALKKMLYGGSGNDSL